MPQLIADKELMVTVDHHLFVIIDQDCEEDEKNPPPLPHTTGHFMATGVAGVWVESEEDILNASLRLECWDGPAPFDESEWPRSDIATVRMPSGVLGIDQITAGCEPDVFTLPGPGEYRVRVAWRELGQQPLVDGLDELEGDAFEEAMDKALDEDGDEPEAYCLAQYWPVDRP